MKNLILIIHANGQQDMSDLLRNLEPVQGFTFTHVEGHGAHSEQDPFLSVRDKGCRLCTPDARGYFAGGWGCGRCINCRSFHLKRKF